jgi:hypothetical protein
MNIASMAIMDTTSQLPDIFSFQTYLLFIYLYILLITHSASCSFPQNIQLPSVYFLNLPYTSQYI